jgi:hypothetical protein
MRTRCSKSMELSIDWGEEYFMVSSGKGLHLAFFYVIYFRYSYFSEAHDDFSNVFRLTSAASHYTARQRRLHSQMTSGNEEENMTGWLRC